MINRRELIGAAAGIVLFGQGRLAKAQTLDLLIRGGRVIDPSVGLDAVRDIAVAGGRIVDIATRSGGRATATIDASGKIVTPGLVDIHTHAGRDAGGPALALRDGVTCLVDAGSAGADNIDALAAELRAAPQTCCALLNIARTGVISGGGELLNLENANVALAREAIAVHRGVVAGVKARLSEPVVGANDLEALRRAQAAATPFDLPVMIHIGQSYSPLRAILPLLKRGDIVTHMYAPLPNGVLDERGRLYPDVLAARRRGVVFDFGNGRNFHFDWDMVERATDQGFWPDTISTDWNVQSSTTGVIDFPNVMSKLLLFGMPLTDVVASATINAARLFPQFEDRGTLNIGAPADITIMELREGDFEFVDNYDNRRTGTQRLFPSATVLGGRIIERGA